MNDQITSTGQPPLAPPRPPEQRPLGRAARARWVLLLIVLLATTAATGYWYLTRDEATTDDAYTDGHAVTIAPQVPGTVVALKVADNQRVAAGDVLIEIDPRAYAAARDQARASLQVAEAQLANARTALDAAKIDFPARLAVAQAQLAAARASWFKADADARRQRGLPRQATSQQDIDNANAALRSADAQVRAGAGRGAPGRARAANDRRGRGAGAPARGAGGAGARPARAGRVNCPGPGSPRRRTAGSPTATSSRATTSRPAQAIFAIVTPELWITANFKESQLARMRPGQRVISASMPIPA